ncbi:MAG: sugar ABC transporter substrate-binding protein [Gemmiger sp.]|nr:sugar ABC transporter substrate-binding protein [Gemmiger sp.]
MKRLLAWILTLAMAFSLVACGGGGTSTATSTAASTDGTSTSTAETTGSGEKVTLSFWTLALQPTFTDFIQGLIDEYEAENPNITIDWQDLPWDGIQDKFLTQTAGGNPPDVVNIWSQLALTYGSKGALLDLDANATEEQKSIYLDAAYDSARLGDKVYAFPWYATPNICVYNKDLLAKGGITEIPKTYQELFDLAIDFHNKTGAYLFTPSTMFHMFYSYGIPMLDDTKTTATFNTPETLQLVTDLKALGDAGAINTDGGAWDNWDGDRQLYANGKLAMILGGPQTVTRLRDEASSDIMDVTDVSEMVLGPANVSGEAIMNLVVSSASKHPQEAIAFANYLTNDANQLAFCHQVSIFPTTKAAAADPFFQSDKETLEGKANYYASLSAVHATDMTLGIEKDDDVKRAIDNMADMLFASGMTPQQAIDQAINDVNTLLAQ